MKYFIVILFLFLIGCATSFDYKSKMKLAKVWDVMESGQCQVDVNSNVLSTGVVILQIISKAPVTPSVRGTSENFFSTTHFYSDLPHYKEIFPRVKTRIFLPEDGNRNTPVAKNILDQIDIYENIAPDKPYKVLGEIVTVLKDNNLSADCINKYEIHRKLKETAYRVGANAVINVNIGDKKMSLTSFSQSEITGIAVEIEK